jgi:hypothetical protein
MSLHHNTHERFRRIIRLAGLLSNNAEKPQKCSTFSALVLQQRHAPEKFIAQLRTVLAMPRVWPSWSRQEHRLYDIFVRKGIYDIFVRFPAEPNNRLASGSADQINRGTNPSPSASIRPAKGAPTWPGHARAPVDAQCWRMRRRLTRACSASEFLGKFHWG